MAEKGVCGFSPSWLDGAAPAEEAEEEEEEAAWASAKMAVARSSIFCLSLVTTSVRRSSMSESANASSTFSAFLSILVVGVVVVVWGEGVGGVMWVDGWF
jgi:hypothetical protein